MPRQLIDETGNTYGQLTVIESVRRPGDRKTMWRCKCSSGYTKYYKTI